MQGSGLKMLPSAIWPRTTFLRPQSASIYLATEGPVVSIHKFDIFSLSCLAVIFFQFFFENRELSFFLLSDFVSRRLVKDLTKV